MNSGPSSEMLSVLEQVPSMYLILSPDFTILTASNLYLDTVRTPKAELVGKHIFEAFPDNPEYPDADGIHNIHTSLLEVIRTKMPHHMAIQRYDTPDPENIGKFIVRYWDPIHTPIIGDDGEISFIIQLATNVTDFSNIVEQYEERKSKQYKDIVDVQALNEELASINEELHQTQSELVSLNNSLQDQVDKRTVELSRSEQKYRSLIENSPIAMQVFRGDSLTFELVNKSMLEFLGKGEEIIGKTLFEGVPEIVGQPIVENLQHVLKTGEPLELYAQKVTLIRNGQAHTGFYDVIYRAILDNGRVSGILGIAIDVTVQIQAQRAIEESEEKFRSLLLLAPVAMNVFSSREFIIELANEKMLEIWGKGNNVIGMTLTNVLPELNGQPFFDILQQVFDTGEAYYGNESMAILDRNGVLSECYFNLVYKPIRNEMGEVSAVLQVAYEVTEQVKARKELIHSQERMQMAMSAANLGSFQINPENREFISSPQLKQFFGYDKNDELPYGAAVDRIHVDYRQYVIDKIEATIQNDEQYVAEYPIIGFHDHKTRWVRAVGGMQQGGDGQRYFIGIINEITEQKQDEQRKNDFIGMVSHELKTPVTSLKAYMQLMERFATEKGDAVSTGILEKSLVQIKKMSTMIDGFLNVSRLESGKISIESQTFDMADLITETEEESSSMYTSHQIIFAPVKTTYVSADRNKISQVVNNLISNAVKYSPYQSTIHVACLTIEGYAQVSVSDEGPGVSVEENLKLFERFYRSPNVSQGTIAGFGIGLYLSAEIIQRHGGKIWVESELGKGATFYFAIPIEA